MFFCNKCGLCYTDIREFKLHENICDENAEQKTKQEIASRYKELQHPKTVKFTCDICGTGFDRTFNGRRHQAACENKRAKKSSQTSCGKCSKVFSSYSSRLRHEKICQGRNKDFKCRSCDLTFPSSSELVVHENESGHNCAGGSGGSDIKRQNINLSEETEKEDETMRRVKCRKCGKSFGNRKLLYEHRIEAHHQSRDVMSQLQQEPWEKPPWVDEDGKEDELLKKCYKNHKHLILQPNELIAKDKPTYFYNFPISNVVSLNDLIGQIERIYGESQFSFKVNLSFGVILTNLNSGEYRYFVPYYNDCVFSRPMLISNRSDLEKFRDRLAKIDILNYVLKQRENTKWKPVLITNVKYDIYRTTFPLGHVSSSLPDYIKKSKSIISFETNPNTSKPYSDNLCFFRCLAYHKRKSIYIENLCHKLYNEWCSYVRVRKIKSYDITLDRMFHVEKCFNINIHIYTLDKAGAATSRYKSREEMQQNDLKDIIFLNLHEHHLSYITNFETYSKKFRCRLCDKLFTTRYKCNVHEKVCNKATQIKFPGGYYSLPKTVFEKLDELNIHVENKQRCFPWFITFDFESLLLKQTQRSEGKLEWNFVHKPVSVSVCSNVEGFTQPKFFLNEDLNLLLKEMINYMNMVSEESYRLAKIRWKSVFESLDKLEREWQSQTVIQANESSNSNNDTSEKDEFIDDGEDDDEDANDFEDSSEAMETNENEPPSLEFQRALEKENVFYSFLERIEKTNEINVQYNNWLIEDEDNLVHDDQEGECYDQVYIHDDYDMTNINQVADKDSRVKENQINGPQNDMSSSVPGSTVTLMLKSIKETREAFESYCQIIPCLGYNSSNYDLNLIKMKLAEYLGLHLPKQKQFVVKRNNSYMCLTNDKLKFLDMMNYLPPGTSYDKFLATFKIKQRKTFFPYEYFCNTDVLHETRLPPKEAFYSSLKQANVLENNIRTCYDRLVEKENKTKEEALRILNLKEEPPSLINERYTELLNIWKNENMHTFRDYLEYYNNLDSFPFVEGVLAFKEFFIKHEIDVFKDCISIPGVARKMLYSSGIKNGASFSLIDRQDEDLYKTIKQGLVGGPSIVFRRHHKVGETFIRDNVDKQCKSIVGYDANSLYLHSICQPMPVGDYSRRKKENDFKPIKSKSRYKSMYHWMDWISKSRNVSVKHKMNYGKEIKIGPYYIDGFEQNTNKLYEFLGCYFHGHSCYLVGEKLSNEKKQKLFQRTNDRLTFLRNKGYDVESIWECEYYKECKQNNELKCFINQRQLPFHKKYPHKVSMKQILKAVVDESFFGFLEVDINVPEKFEDVEVKPETDLSPYEYFKEMSPLFCTSKIPFDHIGSHMQEFVEANNLSKKPRKLLVGGMKAKQILLASPLLKWYIEHGMQVTDVYQVIEYSKMACFEEFGNQITAARRLGDVDPTQEIISMIHKLIGNSSFGGTIIDILRYLSIKYVKGFKQSCLCINNPRFKKLTSLSNDLYETEFNKSRLTMNLPIQLGFSILQYAKLTMLKFYYDFLDKYVERKDFEYIEMDTDSAYMALSENSLMDCIKPNLKAEFKQQLYANCIDNFQGSADNWFPRECCSKHKMFDARTPGIMKIEFQGNEMVALCSKSYIAYSEDTRKTKYSMKGVNKDFIDPMPLYKSVLNTKHNETGVNRGFRMYNNEIHSYTQQKNALNYFYCKRILNDDGINTSPLDLTLTPVHIDDNSDLDE